MGGAWRFMAYRAVDRTPLDLDLPLDVSELGWVLNGAGSLRATVTPDVGALRGPDGRLILEEWGTLIFAEADGEIRWGGIVVASNYRDNAWEIEAASFATYPHGMAYTGLYSRIGVDPAQVVRDIWQHLQDMPDGNLGVTITGDSTPTRLGKAAIPAIPQVYLGGKWQNRSAVNASDIEVDSKGDLAASMTKTATSLTLATVGNFASIALPFDVKIGSEVITVRARSGKVLSSLIRGVGKSNPAAHGKGTDVKYTGTPTRTIDAVAAEPYVLAWDEATDLGGEIASLADTYSFDLVEQHRWNGDTIASSFEIAYPRTGTRRTDLAFIQGDNVVEVVTPAFDGNEYANVIVGVGAGEGTKSVHTEVGSRDGRLRRTAVYTDKTAKTTDRLAAAARNVLAHRLNVLEIPEITVRDHDNARIGSWALGDDVLVEATIPWLGEVSLWHRVTGWSLLSQDRARLTLARSDSFTYGG